MCLKKYSLNCEIEHKSKLPLALVIPATPEINLYAVTLRIDSSHHTSPVAGGDIYFSAEAYAKNGIFTCLSDKSGHYKPPLYSFAYGISYLRSQNVNLSEILIKVTIANTIGGQQRDYANGAFC